MLNPNVFRRIPVALTLALAACAPSRPSEIRPPTPVVIQYPGTCSRDEFDKKASIPTGTPPCRDALEVTGSDGQTTRTELYDNKYAGPHGCIFIYRAWNPSTGQKYTEGCFGHMQQPGLHAEAGEITVTDAQNQDDGMRITTYTQ